MSAAGLRGRLAPYWRPVWVILRREILDTLRDWRMVVPILLLTLVFPVLMNFTAQYIQGFVQQYGAANRLIGDRLIPFLLMIVGFFPISFSLIIALETFAGEKERKSLEALLSTPLTDTQLYLGKVLGAMAPPLLASYFGMTLYVLGVYGAVRWVAPAELLVLVFALTTVHAIVMVCGAVVVSSQVTSVRASNLLASFIIIPMALLIQAESMLMFWADYRPLWLVTAALVLVAAILMRMGVHLFNREELLGREIDELNLRWAARQFVANWFEGVPAGRRLDPRAWYRYSLGATLGRLRLPAGAVVLGIVAAFGGGWYLSGVYPLPTGLLGDMRGQLAGLPEMMLAMGPLGFLAQNLRTLAISAALGIFTFGAVGVVVVMAPFAFFGYSTGLMALNGYAPLQFLAAFLLPHGIAETPAIVLAGAAALRLGATVTAPRAGTTLGEAWMQALTDFVKVFVAVALPLLVVAAFLEVYLTPRVVLMLFGSP